MDKEVEEPREYSWLSKTDYLKWLCDKAHCYGAASRCCWCLVSLACYFFKVWTVVWVNPNRSPIILTAIRWSDRTTTRILTIFSSYFTEFFFYYFYLLINTLPLFKTNLWILLLFLFMPRFLIIRYTGKFFSTPRKLYLDTNIPRKSLLNTTEIPINRIMVHRTIYSVHWFDSSLPDAFHINEQYSTLKYQ